MNDTQEQRRSELGDFARACRDRLKPDAIGLPASGRRRTPGLRREEVAQLSGVSTTWYTWLEQGRDMSLSPAALARLSNVLRLSRAERGYLFELAGKRDPAPAESAETYLPPALAACVESIATPAYVLDRGWNAVAWNEEAERLFVGWLRESRDRNLLRYIFLNDAAPGLISEYQARARRVVAEFRADVGSRLDDPGVHGLVEDLKARSVLFAGLWEEHSVLGREGGRRTFHHPAEGRLRYEQVTFNLSGQPELKLVVLVRTADEETSG